MGAAPARDVREIIARLREADSLDPAERGELNPSLLILEALAVRESPPYAARAIADLRAANKRLLVRAAELAGENVTCGIPEFEVQLRESSDATGRDRSR